MMRAGPAAAAAAAPIPANHPGSGSFKVHNVFFFYNESILHILIGQHSASLHFVSIARKRKI